jgi:hypothetical protein
MSSCKHRYCFAQAHHDRFSFSPLQAQIWRLPDHKTYTREDGSEVRFGERADNERAKKMEGFVLLVVWRSPGVN